MVEDGRIVRADVDSTGVPTLHGIQVGSPVSAVEGAFGPRRDAGWRYLIVFERDTSRALVFEVDSHVVRTFRTGLVPQVGYVERCG